MSGMSNWFTNDYSKGKECLPSYQLLRLYCMMFNKVNISQISHDMGLLLCDKLIRNIYTVLYTLHIVIPYYQAAQTSTLKLSSWSRTLQCMFWQELRKYIIFVLY